MNNSGRKGFTVVYFITYGCSAHVYILMINDMVFLAMVFSCIKIMCISFFFFIDFPSLIQRTCSKFKLPYMHFTLWGGPFSLTMSSYFYRFVGSEYSKGLKMLNLEFWMKRKRMNFLTSHHSFHSCLHW